ncbi:FRG domain-containing protein [Leptospira bourretii]|uniref:FRG domain-containing protein n=1 Tax=Leptospira bourretii TaxID=2484962 RepID=A0ABY2LIB3_9LEPT|nr:FRG domain-containing protein [Leptospira bourretii]TGK94057.1 FRG domain-containing protein [Leptospira bourretii]
MIQEIEINTLDELEKIQKQLDVQNWIYRGVADKDWNIQTSIDRVKKGTALLPYFEYNLLDYTFRSKKLYKELSELDFENYLEVLSFLQHYGAPTRLLDFTRSFYIALFFAFEDPSLDTNYSSIFAFNHLKFRTNFYKTLKLQYSEESNEIDINKYNQFALTNNHEVSFNTFFNEILIENNFKFILPLEPNFFNQRIFVQQGLFLIQGSIDISFQENLEIYDKSELAENILKININRKLISNIILNLAKMGITPYSIYPGIDGFLKDLKLSLFRDYFKIYT